MPKFNKKIAAVAAAAAVLVAGAGTAFAYWTTTGAGTGSATNGSANGSIVLHATFADGLTPGGSEPVSYTADNAGSSSLYVGTITPTVSIDSAHATAGCLVADFTIAPTTSNTTVPANTSGMAVGSGTLSFTDTSVSQDGCKGAVITLSLASN
ncbi:MAG TPA: hypothetical protein VFU36_10940 [Jatrophihabitans sp.]|nr:hypothetical protein [Jatrophihabitans sp.]